jgi:hypothetical protein
MYDDEDYRRPRTDRVRGDGEVSGRSDLRGSSEKVDGAGEVESERSMNDESGAEQSDGNSNETHHDGASTPQHKMFFDPKMSASEIAKVIVANAKERGIH